MAKVVSVIIVFAVCLCLMAKLGQVVFYVVSANPYFGYHPKCYQFFVPTHAEVDGTFID